jgi:prepilin-type N-terminal cleavage/methylation domain-containing protein
MERRSGEAGYTLTELLVVCALFGMIAAASLGLYKVAQETYTSTSGLVDSQSEARAAIDRMAADLRLAGSFVVGATSAPTAVSSASSSAITFLADIDGDTLSSGAEATASSAAGTSVVVSSATGFSASEYLYIASGITREVRQISSISGTTLTLSASLTNSFSSGSIVRSVESVAWSYSSGTLTRQVGSGTAETVASNLSSFTLTYYDSSNNTTTTASSIRRIKVNLTVGSGSAKRTLEVEVHPVSLSLS